MENNQTGRRKAIIVVWLAVLFAAALLGANMVGAFCFRLVKDSTATIKETDRRIDVMPLALDGTLNELCCDADT